MMEGGNAPGLRPPVEAEKMLDVDNVVPFLLDHGLVQRNWILDGELTIRSAARRNRNLRIEGPGGNGCLIKQPDELSHASRRTLANEACFYQFCHEEEAARSVSAYLPRLTLRDHERGLHAIELIPNARPLHAHHLPGASSAVPVEPSESLGRGLGTLHRVFRRPGLADDPRLDWLRDSLPWIFRVHRPAPSLMANLCPAEARVFQVVQSEPELGARLEDLASQWRGDAVIHGDIKSENILVSAPPGDDPRGAFALWIIDWEFVQVGDPAWDLAGALHDYVVFWTSSMPLQPTISPEEMVARAEFPLEMIQPALRAFWHGYLVSAGMESERAGAHAVALLRRSVAFSGARLVLAAVELAHERDELPVQAVLLLQIAVNLLADPDRARTGLYGIGAEANLP
jgi:hypothetical protein